MILRRVCLATQLVILMVGSVSAETIQIEDGPRIDGAIQFKGDKLRITTQTGEGDFALSRIESILPSAVHGTESCKSLELMVRALRYREIHPEDPQGSDRLMQSAYDMDPTNVWIMCGYAWSMLDRFDVSGANAFLTEHESPLRTLPEEYLALRREAEIRQRYTLVPSDLALRLRSLDLQLPKPAQNNRVWCHGAYKVVDTNGISVPQTEYNLNGSMQDQTIEALTSGWVVISGTIYQHESPPVFSITAKVFPPTVEALQVRTGSNQCMINEPSVFRKMDPGLAIEVVGKVCDVQNEPIRGATITCTHPTGLQTNTVTDQEGNYAFMLVPASYSLQVSANEYQQQSTNVIVQRDTTAPVPVISLSRPEQPLRATIRVCMNLAGGVVFDSPTNVLLCEVEYPVQNDRGWDSSHPIRNMLRRAVFQEKGQLFVRAHGGEWIKDLDVMEFDTLKTIDADQFFALESDSKGNSSEQRLPLIVGHVYIGSFSPMHYYNQGYPKVTVKFQAVFHQDTESTATAAK